MEQDDINNQIASNEMIIFKKLSQLPYVTEFVEEDKSQYETEPTAPVA